MWKEVNLNHPAPHPQLRTQLYQLSQVHKDTSKNKSEQDWWAKLDTVYTKEIQSVHFSL